MWKLVGTELREQDLPLDPGALAWPRRMAGTSIVMQADGNDGAKAGTVLGRV